MTDWIQGDDLPTLLFVVAIGIISFVLLRRWQRYFLNSVRNRDARARQGSRRSTRASRAQDAARHTLATSSANLANWEVQMHDTARDLSGKLDAKISALRQLVAEADRAADRLEAVLDRMEPAPQQPDESNDAVPEAPKVPRSAEVAGHGEVGAARDRFDEIYTLSDYGFPITDIASRMGMPVGEVELILSLRYDSQDRLRDGE